MGALCGIAVCGSFLLLLLSVFPGLLADASMFALIFSPFWFPASCIGAVIYLDLFNHTPDISKPPLLERRWVPIVAIVLAINLALLGVGAPRRLVFRASRGAFVPWLAAAADPVSKESTLNRRLGLYHVDLVAGDPRGGVYFRTHRGPDGISWRQRNYGFVHKPNPIGSPFGDEKYGVTHLGGDWYCFAASGSE